MYSVNKYPKTIRLVIIATIVSLMTVFAMFQPVYAAKKQSSKPAKSSTEQSDPTGNGSVKDYKSATDLEYGTIVQLNKDNSVAPVAKKDINNMYGVVVDPQSLSVTLTNPAYEHQAYVATSGNYNVLVDDQAGSIKAGDYLTLSSISGVAMQAHDDEVLVIGRALNSFDGKTNTLGSTTLKDSTGKEIKQVSFGIIPVAINIQKNPTVKSTKVKTPNLLQQIGRQIAKKPITPIKLYLSTTIVFMSIIIAVVLLYSGIRNGMISIGRNPLSKKVIFRGLLEVILGAFVILIIGFFAVYLLLKL